MFFLLKVSSVITFPIDLDIFSASENKFSFYIQKPPVNPIFYKMFT